LSQRIRQVGLQGWDIIE